MLLAHSMLPLLSVCQNTVLFMGVWRTVVVENTSWAVLFLVAGFYGDFAVGQVQSEAEQLDGYAAPLERKIEGWTVNYDSQLDLPENSEVANKSFKALANHLQRIEYIVPAKRLKQLKQCKIWVELKHPRLKTMQYHPSRGWLVANDCDPRLEKHLHVPLANQLYARQMWAQHPYVILHELAHAYHDQFLGFDNPEIEKVFQAAKNSGMYDTILNHLGDSVEHYGMNNAKEYFAEMTEAYFGVNDFFPFVRAELKQHDPQMYRLLEKIWGKI